jgi:hypothetical protein
MGSHICGPEAEKKRKKKEVQCSLQFKLKDSKNSHKFCLNFEEPVLNILKLTFRGLEPL